MKTPLAWLIMAHNKFRTCVAVAGVSFAVVLLFMQLGFLGAVQSTATLIYNALDFDLAIRSKEYLHVADPRSFPESRLRQAAADPNVVTVSPFYVEWSSWRNPHNGRQRGILAMGTRPQDHVFRLAEIRAQTGRLTVPEFLLVDRKSRVEFGPVNGRQFSGADNGIETEVGNQRVRIVGNFELGGGLAADGSILMSDRGFARVMPGRSTRDVSLGLVKLRDAGRAERVAAGLRRALPADVEVLTRDEVFRYELDRWVNETQIGAIFQLGVVLALIVGAAIVYQVLSSDVGNHLPEYATIKAMGYENRFLTLVVLRQAALLGVFGFALGLCISLVLYRVTSAAANVPVEMTWSRIAIVLVLSIAMCGFSAFLATRRLRTVDPAELF